jgi:hypothetical protein
MFEMLFGYPPFFSDTPEETYRKVFLDYVFELFVFPFYFQVLQIIVIFVGVFAICNITLTSIALMAAGAELQGDTCDSCREHCQFRGRGRA